MSHDDVSRSEAIQLKRILIATDFSDASRNAVRYAAAITRHYGARLYVVHVLSSIGYRMVGPDAVMEAAECAVHDLRKLWNKLGVNSDSSAIELAFIVRQGEVCAVLADLIQKEHIDLVVVGTRGLMGLSKVALGSVAEAIFRTASCPVLTVGPSSASDWPQRELGAEKVILLATDFEDASLRALPYAVSIADRSRSKLVVFHVAKCIPEDESTAIPGIREASLQRLKQLIPDDLGIEVDLRVTCSTPVDTILSEAASTVASLVVLGIHQKSLFVPPGHLPSTTAYGVVIEAKCPVLTVRTGRRVKMSQCQTACL